MNTTYLVLLILLIIYVPFYIYVRKSDAMRQRGIVPYGPFVMFKTTRGIRHLDRIAKYKRFWSVFGTLSKIIAVILMLMIVFIIVVDLFLLPLMVDAPGLGVEYALALPGINPMLPLHYGVLGLVVAVVIHEMAHGIQTRANDMKVESTGLLYAVVPVGAFVEPNEEEIQKCGRKPRTDMYAAGIAVNLIAAVVIFLIMSFGMMGSMSSDFGDRAGITGVLDDSPADDSGLIQSSIIMEVYEYGATAPFISSYDELTSSGTKFDPTMKYSVVYATRDGGPAQTETHLGVFINSIAKGSPAENATSPSASEPGIPKNSFLANIDGHDIENLNDFRWLLDLDNPNRLQPGDAVTVTVIPYKDGDVGTAIDYEVTMGNNGGRAYLGVTYSLSGMTFTTPDDVLQGARNPIYNVESVLDIPYAAMAYIGKPFRGFDPIPSDQQWWFHSSIMPDGAFWVILTARSSGAARAGGVWGAARSSGAARIAGFARRRRYARRPWRTARCAYRRRCIGRAWRRR
ncbi:MAG: site-2 protease family protein, partial [Methanomassiliicoccaceae archaeon]|nr:site-2 protease family protein [Methanomassiliicoccaceae archaeon]